MFPGNINDTEFRLAYIHMVSASHKIIHLKPDWIKKIVCNYIKFLISQKTC